MAKETRGGVQCQPPPPVRLGLKFPAAVNFIHRIFKAEN